jgi:hypothetical protein
LGHIKRLIIRDKKKGEEDDKGKNRRGREK